jgi:anti-sigma regulatory factor (Ser/Thr protein kinase)
MGMSRATPQEHDSVEFRMSPRDPGQARRWLLVRGGDLPQDHLDLLLLLLSELVTNCVRHSGAAPGDRVEIGLERWKGTIHVDVQDPGHGFDRRDLRPGPHGLEIVEAGADRWGIEDSGPTTVWFELDVA